MNDSLFVFLLNSPFVPFQSLSNVILSQPSLTVKEHPDSSEYTHIHIHE